MNRRHMSIAVVITATTSLLLTACGGGGGDSKDNDKIAGAGAAEAAATPTLATASPSNSADRPKITFPADVKEVFEGWSTGDAVKDALLADVQGAQQASDYAIAEGNADEAALSYYYRGDALATTSKWVQSSFVDKGITITGTIRYFDPRVSVTDDTSGSVRYCSDESEAFSKVRKTGKVNKTPVNDDSYVLYNVKVEKSDQGVWQTTDGLSDRGNEVCTP
uniref:Lipoprotein n=2 Tax=Streptomyces TaxID=1883 RepID=A0AAU1ZWP5_9ACTN